MGDGYVKIFRQLRDWGWYTDGPTKDVFLELLLTANYHPSEYKGLQLLPGQAVIGRKKLADNLGLSEQQVRTALEHLKATGEITIEATNQFSVVTIEKWEFWQVDDGESTSTSTNESTNNQPTTNQQLTTSKKVRNKESSNSNTTKSTDSTPYKEIADMYKSICVSYPKLKGLSAKRKKSIAARYKEHGKDIEVFRELFTKAEESSFLKGNSDSGWKAGFDWMMNSDNFNKILEDMYKNRDGGGNYNGNSSSNSSDSGGDESNESVLFRKRSFDFS